MEKNDYIYLLIKTKQKKMKKYYRSKTDKVIGGVCGGLGEYTDSDPVLWRIAFFLVFFLAAASFWIYVTLWIVSKVAPIPPIAPKTLKK